MTDKYGENPKTPDELKKTPNPAESNDFPKITEFVSQEWLEGKKDIIDKVLSDKKIKEWFENFLRTANLLIRTKIKKDLLNCKTEEEVKSIIVETLPWYKIWESSEKTWVTLSYSLLVWRWHEFYFIYMLWLRSLFRSTETLARS